MKLAATISLFMMLTLVTTTVAKAEAYKIGKDGYIQDSKGAVHTGLNQLQAFVLCNGAGLRLPTIREQIQGAKDRGFVIVETVDYEAGRIPAGYQLSDFYLISAAEFDETKDRFYIAINKNSIHLTNASHSYWTWSSSAVSDSPHLAYGLDGAVGVPSGTVRYFGRSAQCLR